MLRDFEPLPLVASASLYQSSTITMPAAEPSGQRMLLQRLAGRSLGLQILSADRKRLLYVLQTRRQRSKGGYHHQWHGLMLEGSALFEVGAPCLFEIVRWVM